MEGCAEKKAAGQEKSGPGCMATGDKMELRAGAEKAARAIMGKNDFALVHHHDADGITAGAIMAKALERAGKKFRAIAVKQVYRETIQEIRGLGKNYLFVDFGSGQLGMIKEEFGDETIVIDHHQPANESLELHFNPMLYGFDGGREISAAGAAYLVAKKMGGKNNDLAALAVVGAVGDMMDLSGALTGLNAEIAEEAVGAGVLRKEVGLRLYGRITRPLVQFLEFASNPIIPGITADEEACVRFLARNGIDLRNEEKWRAYADLTQEEKKKLTTALILHMTEAGAEEWKARELIGEVYTLTKELPGTPMRDAKEYATLCNSCGRHGKSDVALAVCMGDRMDKYAEAMSLLAEHRRQLREGLELMTGEGVEDNGSYYFYDAKDRIKETIVGIIAGMLYGAGQIKGDKPIIALARNEDGTIKASGRATWGLVRQGINLGKAFKAVCARLGGKAEGGGHAIAAGCKFDEKQLPQFRAMLEEELQRKGWPEKTGKPAREETP